jgi:uncharacterized protein YkwD
MRNPLRKITVLVALAIAALAAFAATPSIVTPAKADACHRYGRSMPGTISKEDARRAVLCLVNKKRQNYGRAPLDGNSRLTDAAQRHTDYMESHHCFSHQCGGEGSLPTRLSYVGYLGGGLLSWMYGENIGWGEERYATATQMVRAWMHSPEHRSNILYSTFRDFGVGVVWGTPQSSKANGAIWTTDFGYKTG